MCVCVCVCVHVCVRACVRVCAGEQETCTTEAGEGDVSLNRREDGTTASCIQTL